MGTDIPTDCGVPKKINAQVRPSAPVCCDEFCHTYDCNFHGCSCNLHHRDVLVSVSRNASLQFLLVKCIHGAQYQLELKKKKGAVSVTFVLQRTRFTFLDYRDEDVFHCHDYLVSGSQHPCVTTSYNIS
jgi:hypothetical protein